MVRWFLEKQHAKMPPVRVRLILSSMLVLAAIGGVFVWYGIAGTNTSYETVWVDDEEPCVDHVSLAKPAASFAKAEIEARQADGSGGCDIGWEGTRDDLAAYDWLSPIFDMYDREGGRRDVYGFERIGDRYVVTMNVDGFSFSAGDTVVISFDDGTKIDAVAIPVNDTADYDEGEVINVGNEISFWGDSDETDLFAVLREATGGKFTRVVSVESRGVSADVMSGSVIGGSVRSASDARRAVASGAVDECRANTPYDNSTLARAAVSFSWSNDGESEPTSLYQEVVDATVAPDCRDDGKCCYCTVRAAIMWSGADANFPQANYITADEYLEASPLWERVEGAQDVNLVCDEEFIESHGIEPGDFAITTPEYWISQGGQHGHVAMYVSRDITTEVYENFVKGRIGDGDNGVPDTMYVQSSYRDFAARCTDYQDLERKYNFWRYVGDYSDRDVYANVGSEAGLSYARLAGTSCDCEEHCEEDLGDELAWLAVKMAGWEGSQANAIFEPSANPWKKVDDPRLDNEFAIMDATLGRYHGNNAYASCNQAACGAIAAVVDMDIIPHKSGSGNSAYLLDYVVAHPQFFQEVKAESMDDLEPGDILIAANIKPGYEWIKETQNYDSDGYFTSIHTAIYVGNEFAQKKFPGSSACVYQAGYDDGSFGDHHARYPGLEGLDFAGVQIMKYRIFRPIAKNTNAQYPDVDYKRLVDSWGLPKKCRDEAESEVASGEGLTSVVEMAKTQLGLPYETPAGRTQAEIRNPNPPALDCSGFVIWSYYQALGVNLLDHGLTGSYMLWQNAVSSGLFEETTQDGMVPGDLIVGWCGPGSDWSTGRHTEMYIGDGQVIHEDGYACNITSLDVGMRMFYPDDRIKYFHYIGPQ